eukprot:TRINITY_DN597_c0_g4_i1.p2 TRINITY_DN597_c0_g4~~TRINITY_DN597_c0_g4_i1.p2  ORF type:complete len:197 (-),score=29.38 TRINITY_DN597_c0_g4_i1:888-1478(-)
MTASDEEFFDVKESWESPKESEKSVIEEMHKHSSGSSKSVVPIPKQVIDKVILRNYNKPIQRRKISIDLALGRRRSFISCKENGSERADISGVYATEVECPARLSVGKDKKCVRGSRVKVKGKSKSMLEFSNLFLQQELKSGDGAIWVARFSPDGYFFAAGGEDSHIKVWQVRDHSLQCTPPTHTSPRSPLQSKAD